MKHYEEGVRQARENVKLSTVAEFQLRALRAALNMKTELARAAMLATRRREEERDMPEHEVTDKLHEDRKCLISNYSYQIRKFGQVISNIDSAILLLTGPNPAFRGPRAIPGTILCDAEDYYAAKAHARWRHDCTIDMESARQQWRRP